MADVIEIWADTQESLIRPMTDQELAQRQKDEAAAEDAAQAAAQQAAQTAAATQAAIAHAKSLGFTDEMIAVMYPNLAP